MTATSRPDFLDPDKPAEERHRMACPGIVDIETRLAENPDCAWNHTDRRRWFYCNQGPWSSTHAPELLVMVSLGSDPDTERNWYGHAFCINEGERNHAWVSILVRTGEFIDERYDEDALYRYFESVIRGNRYEPGYARNEDDIASRHDTFREAVDALAGKIRNFSREERDPWTVDGAEVPPPGSERCDRCFHAYDLTRHLVTELLDDGIGGPRPVKQRIQISERNPGQTPRFARVDERVRTLERHSRHEWHYPYPDNTPDRIPTDEEMELKIVYGSFSRRSIYVDPEEAASRLLETLGCWYGTMRNAHFWYFHRHERWPADMHCLLSELVDVELLPLQRAGFHLAYHPVAALIRTSIVLDYRSGHPERLFLRYEGMSVQDNESNNPGSLALLRQENRPTAKVTERTWRDTVRWERPHQCAWKCQ